MLLALTQRSSELSEEASGMNLDKSSDNLEAIERLILENQQIKQEIQNLTDVIRKKSFGSSDGGDGFISRFFK
jgi:DNA anti-recombination protein RmuC